MQKEVLRKLRRLNATKEMMEKGKRYEEKTYNWYDGTKHKKKLPEYDFLLRVQNLGGYIKVAVFLPEMMREDIRTPAYEIFINEEGKEWITRKLDREGKEAGWSDAMLDNLEKIELSMYSEGKVYLNQDGRETLERLTTEDGKKYKGVRQLLHWQREQREQARVEKERRQQEPWDADMKLVPELMPGFLDWMRRDVCKEFFIFYKYKRGGAKEGYCSRCRRTVQIKDPGHNKKTTCPACGAKAVFKADSRIQTLGTAGYEAAVIQKIRGGVVVRRFYQSQWYRDAPYKEPNQHVEELSRTLVFDDGRQRRYRWELYKNKYRRWCPDDKVPMPGWDRVKLYKKNSAAIKKTAALRRSTLFLWDELPVGVERYLYIEQGNPAVEMLARIGMFRMARELIYSGYDRDLMDQEKTELTKLLKIDRARLERLKTMGGGVTALRWMQEEKLRDTVWPDEMIRDFEKGRIEKPSEFYFLKVPVKFVKCWRYLKKQADLAGNSVRQMMTTWRDYICMADQMKMATGTERIAYPKDLKAEHDRLVYMSKAQGLEKKAKEMEKKWPKVNSQLGKLAKYEYRDKKYCIVAPRKMIDIVTEGVVLGHCIHTCDYYFSRIQKDESYIFFLRRAGAPDVPWYTLEVESSGNIRQKRTTGDNQNKDLDQALPFLKKWQQYYRKQMTEDERKLGERADALRRENYKQLRENGNKVWHGKLAGQLLADVLERDLMEVM